MPRRSSRKVSSINQTEDFSVTIRQARFRISGSYRDDNDFGNEERIKFMRFVKEKFHSVECRHFVIKEEASDKLKTKCMCGEMIKYHKEDKSPFNDFPQWSVHCSMESLPTNTFGKIEFTGEDIINTKLTDFVRISYKDKMDDILDLLFNYWEIDVGKLCISVIGGGKKFKMLKNHKDIFCQGLIKAAKTTNALIITSGLNLGITKIVGDAIQDSQSYFYDKSKHNNLICCLGIAPWGYVKNRKILETAKGKTIQYKVSNEIKLKKPVSLNKNHTHYFFIDDGRRLDFVKTETVKFRAALEEEFIQKTDERDGIPVVLIIVEGGHCVFREASRRAKANIPIVICEGTGRAADILGEAFREMYKVSDKQKRVRSDGVPMLPEEYKKELKKKLVEQNISKGKDVKEAIKFIENIIQKEFLITLFDIKAHEDLDRVILYSVIKKMDYICDNQQNSISSQLSLCLIWNRVEIIKDKIFSGDISLSNEEWATFLKESIINGKVEFIELFIQNVSNIQEFLTTAVLKELYERCLNSKYFHKTFIRLIGRKFSKGLFDVKELISKIIGKYENPCFVDDGDIQHPFQELFLWAVLMEKHECAKFFWEKCDDSLCLALVATRIYKRLKGTSVMDTNRNRTLTEWKNYFETLAIKLVEECYDIDQETAAYIIEKENPIWGGISCLELAYKSKDLKFISCVVCQHSIDNRWCAGFNINFFLCILCIIFPCFLFTKKEYDNDYSGQELEENDDDSTLNTYVNYGSKLKRFYTSPQTKFCIHTLTFTTVVVYFSYVVLYGMQRMSLTHHEYVFMIYLFLTIIDKILEMFQLNRIQINGVKYWWKFNNWNRIDVIIIILALVAMLLRLRLVIDIWNEDRVVIYICSKTIYSVIVGLFYIKCLRFLTFHRRLGPKMIMMIKLVQELIMYSIIIIIFLLSYGVTSQSAYYPQRDFSWINLTNVVDFPYWTIFGSLNLNSNVYLDWCDSGTNYNISNNCPERNILIPILFAAYVIISNILLMNVLIATYKRDK